MLHAIHDFLPRHQAGSEIYAFELCRELSREHDVTVLCAEYDLSRAHGEVTWRVYERLPVVEIVNNWRCTSFDETYRPPLIGERLAQVLHAVQPDVVHVHNLMNLSFDLPSLGHAAGAAVVATLHDFTLVCPSGGQRIHQAEHHICDPIDPARCARCFAESPFQAQIGIAHLAPHSSVQRGASAAVRHVARRFPLLLNIVTQAARRTGPFTPTEEDIRTRLGAVRGVYETVDLFVAPSRFVAEEFVTLGIDANKIRVADYGFVPLAQRPTQVADGPLRIGYVGTLVWHKGVHVLLEALQDVRSGFVLKVFGDPAVFPDYMARLRTMARGLPVEFMGAFGREQTGDVYEQIDVLVVPSLWLENSPLVIHEAFMAGVPVVCARMGGICDLVEEGHTGLLYDPTSPTQLAAALRDLIVQPARLRRMAAHVRARKPVTSITEDARDWTATYATVASRREASVRAS